MSQIVKSTVRKTVEQQQQILAYFDDLFGKLKELGEEGHFLELCRSFLKNKKCPFGPNCNFAHSLDELRPRKHRIDHFKMRQCYNFPPQKTYGKEDCDFGSRCLFCHDDVMYMIGNSITIYFSKGGNVYRVSKKISNGEVVAFSFNVNEIQRKRGFDELLDNLQMVLKCWPKKNPVRKFTIPKKVNGVQHSIIGLKQAHPGALQSDLLKKLIALGGKKSEETNPLYSEGVYYEEKNEKKVMYNQLAPLPERLMNNNKTEEQIMSMHKKQTNVPHMSMAGAHGAPFLTGPPEGYYPSQQQAYFDPHATAAAAEMKPQTNVPSMSMAGAHGASFLTGPPEGYYNPSQQQAYFDPHATAAAEGMKQIAYPFGAMQPQQWDGYGYNPMYAPGSTYSPSMFPMYSASAETSMKPATSSSSSNSIYPPVMMNQFSFLNADAPGMMKKLSFDAPGMMKKFSFELDTSLPTIDINNAAAPMTPSMPNTIPPDTAAGMYHPLMQQQQMAPNTYDAFSLANPGSENILNILTAPPGFAKAPTPELNSCNANDTMGLLVPPLLQPERSWPSAPSTPISKFRLEQNIPLTPNKKQVSQEKIDDKKEVRSPTATPRNQIETCI